MENETWAYPASVASPLFGSNDNIRLDDDQDIIIYASFVENGMTVSKVNLLLGPQERASNHFICTGGCIVSRTSFLPLVGRRNVAVASLGGTNYMVIDLINMALISEGRYRNADDNNGISRVTAQDGSLLELSGATIVGRAGNDAAKINCTRRAKTCIWNGSTTEPVNGSSTAACYCPPMASSTTATATATVTITTATATITTPTTHSTTTATLTSTTSTEMWTTSTTTLSTTVKPQMTQTATTTINTTATITAATTALGPFDTTGETATTAKGGLTRTMPMQNNRTTTATRTTNQHNGDRRVTLIIAMSVTVISVVVVAGVCCWHSRRKNVLSFSRLSNGAADDGALTTYEMASMMVGGASTEA